ncbi:histidine kinase dimerization/phosphoacceptor domain -containing protein [uncultured Chitinophaga sp.]|uniref:sensor histidine kinase n=1 Tax=uncultured Chitinophaga sp. TaxID=339340 RepID=UPI0025FA12F9|nr:histidine kinase dimerization/phosphoacceptor domain -containing protein [uncultured Chitinophaga sp.]
MKPAGDTMEVKSLLDEAQLLIYKPGELPADLNTAQRLLDRASALFPRLSYLAGETRAMTLQFQLLAEALDHPKIQALLPKLTPAQRCAFLKRVTSSTTSHGRYDETLMYAGIMKDEALRANLPAMANEAEYYISRAYTHKREWRKMKESYMLQIAYHRSVNNPKNELRAWDMLNYSLADTDTLFPSKTYVQEQILSLSTRLGDKVTYAKGLMDVGVTHFVLGRLQKAEETLLAADDLMKKAGYKERYEVYEWLSYLSTVKADAAKAVYYAEASRDNRRETGKDDGEFSYHCMLANMYTTFGQEDRFYEEMSKMTVGVYPETVPWASDIVAFARKFNFEQNARVAIEYLTRRMSDGRVHFTDHDLMYAHSVLGKFYVSLNQPQTALKHMLIAESRIDMNAKYRFSTVAELFLDIAEEYYKLRSYDSAAKYLRRIEGLPKGQVAVRARREMHKLSYRIDSIQGRYQSALWHSAQQKILSDSVFSIEKWGQMQDFEMKYQTARKDQELNQRSQQISWLTSQSELREALFKQTDLAARQRDMLKDRDVQQAKNEIQQREDSLKNKEERIRFLNNEARLQQGLLAQTRTTRNVIILAAILLFVLLLLICNRYLLKQRNNRELEKQKALISHKNESLGKLLSEKEWLLKEVHHRVKNNLQVVMSLLNIQSFYLQDDNAISAIRDSQRRVNAISLIHKKLYQSDNPALVDMPLYICELVDYLRDYADGRGNIKIELDIAPVSLDVRKALPIGLILNESITNAFKYAFPDNADGVVLVSLKGTGKGLMELQIADDGIGLRQHVNDTSKSLGMSLMEGLAKDMDGELTIESEHGATFRVVFPAALQDNGVE